MRASTCGWRTPATCGCSKPIPTRRSRVARTLPRQPRRSASVTKACCSGSSTSDFAGSLRAWREGAGRILVPQRVGGPRRSDDCPNDQGDEGKRQEWEQQHEEERERREQQRPDGDNRDNRRQHEEERELDDRAEQQERQEQQREGKQEEAEQQAEENPKRQGEQPHHGSRSCGYLRAACSRSSGARS